MTSVDSGVETGNDSNDSGQAETHTLKYCPKSTIRDVEWNQKLFLENLAAAFVEMRRNSENNQNDQNDNEDNGHSIDMEREATSTTIVCRTNPTNLSHLQLGAGTSASSLGILPGQMHSSLEFRLPQPFRMASTNWLISCSSRKDCESGEQNKRNKIMKLHSRRIRKVSSHVFQDSMWARRMRSAATTNNIELVKTLLDKGISPNNADEQGRSPLHLACSRGYTEMVKLLLDYGADPNITDVLGNTPLHLAAVTSKISVVTLLLKAGTNVLSSDRHGYNPLQLAQTKLRMLQNCKGSDMGEIKEEVHRVVGMLLAYLQKQKDVTQQIEALSSFCSRLSLSSTTDQLQGDVKNLLASIDTLSLTK